MKKIRAGFIYLLFTLLSLVIMYPVILVILLSIQDSYELSSIIKPLTLFTDSYVHINYLAQFPTLNNFKNLLLYTPEFYTVFWNSLLTVGTILLFQLIVAIPSAWAFARFKFRGKKLLFNLYVIFMLMPFQVTMLSQYLVLDKMNLMNNRWAIILPAVFSTFSVFLIYRGFADIPEDVIDSARIDGANEFKALRHIGLPLGKHGVLACMVLCFLDYWNMVEQPLTFLKDKKLFPLSLYLPTLDLSQAEMILSASVVTLIPSVFVFVIGQDYLEQGIIATALKE